MKVSIGPTSPFEMVAFNRASARRNPWISRSGEAVSTPVSSFGSPSTSASLGGLAAPLRIEERELEADGLEL